uniref:Large ribosomal subunit protein uL16m n=1 Tax=Lagerstroemia indica TaxID=141186 RepID=A0A219YLX3_9MYRT|nr:ribosomal protein L16 [Lagerstroemia indica]AQS99568.1 ribosomal protein L16 [Lagerstroemia indica]
MSGQSRRNGKIWVRVLADLPITGKPTEVRMGRGKGNPTGWIARVSTGQILFEMDGVSLSNARQAATLAAHKPCSSTKFVEWSMEKHLVMYLTRKSIMLLRKYLLVTES